MKSVTQIRWTWVIITIISILIAIIAVIPYASLNQENFAPVFDGRFELGGAYWLYIHVFCGTLALLVGPFQFWKWLRVNYRTLHRWLGRIYLFLGIFPSAIAGLVVAQGTVAGLTGQIGFSLLSIMWIITGGQALQKILKGDITSHRQWMFRNFSLTFAAVTLRLWLPILIVAQLQFGIDPDIAFNYAYQTVPWLSWVPNIIIAEMLIQSRKSSAVLPT